MIRSLRFWRVAAALYVFVNAGGLVFAVAAGEPMHAVWHAGLLVFAVAGYSVLRVAQRLRRQDQTPPNLADQRIEYLQQSVDAIALEVERIGEAQRFHEKLRDQRAETLPPKKEGQ